MLIAQAAESVLELKARIKGNTITQWINIITTTPLLCKISGAILLVQLGVTTGW